VVLSNVDGDVDVASLFLVPIFVLWVGLGVPLAGEAL
jgi:hypothetical protein